MRLLVLGHTGLVGSAIRELVPDCEINSPRADLRIERMVSDLFSAKSPTHVVLAAATVGGIGENMSRPADFIDNNIAITRNVVHCCTRFKARLMFLGSSCIYPRSSPQPIRESALWSGPLEPTNRPYAVAKLAGLEMVDAFRRQHGLDAISVMPTNLYGPRDRFDDTGHVLPALMRRIHEARAFDASGVTVWGTGAARREFMYVEDFARCCLMLLKSYTSTDPINVGTGEDVTIRELVEILCDRIGYKGRVEWDTTKPDGMPEKRLDLSRVNALGWSATTSLRQGISETYSWYLRHVA